MPTGIALCGLGKTALEMASGPPLAPVVVPAAAALLVGCGASGLLLAARRLARRGA